MVEQHHAPAVAWASSLHDATAKDDGFVPVPPLTDGLVGSDPFVNELLHFASSVRDSVEPASSGRDNLETMKAVYACYESAKSANEVLLTDLDVP
jgi:predicted dehydrogenase